MYPLNSKWYFIKITYSVNFSYKTIFAQSPATTGHGQSDVEFYDESYGAQDVTGFLWVQKFYMKNLEKVEKIGKVENIQEYLTKFLHFAALLNVCFYIDRS